MGKKKLARFAGLTALALVALGALGYAVNGGSGNDALSTGRPLIAAQEDGAAGGDVLSAIDEALGRTSTALVDPAVAPAPPMPGATLQFADADQSGRSVANSGAQDAGGVVPGGAGAGNDAALIDDRKIVQTAALQLQVDEVGTGFEEVGRIATAAGGFVASSNFAFHGAQQVASLTVRVPADRYQDVLRDVRALGVRVDSEGSNASDVTEEYTDLQARLRNLEASETRLLELLGRAENISEVLQVQDRINNVRGEIERVLGRIALLDKLSDLATITVHLRPAVAGTSGGGASPLGDAIDEAWADSLAFLEDVAAGVLTVVVFAWWLPFVAVPGYVIGARLLRRPSEPASRPAAPVEGV